MRVRALRRRGVRDLRLVFILAAPEGLEALLAADPDIRVYVCAIDDHLNEHAYILPGLGDMLGIGALQGSMLSNSKTAWIAIVIVCAWQSIAMNTIIYISGLQTVPEDVYEAGDLDGATGWKKFKYLTFPLIIPFFTINMVLCVKNFLMVFDQIMAMTKGGPEQSTESISYLIYNNGLSGGSFGYQSANAVVFFIVIVAISVAQMSISSKKEEQL